MADKEEAARYSRTAREAFCDRTGVCRNYAHLAIALCRCMTIPARYCTVISATSACRLRTFTAWFDAYLGGEWYTFDARDNIRALADFGSFLLPPA